MSTEINYTKILQDRASFQLVRTNPKLTGNVKLTIDENDKMWLNSIDVNDELSKSIYKKKTIDPTMSLASNMYRFFNNGLTPSEIVFDLKENFDSTKTSSDYKDQYDFSKYFSGARYLASRQYTEKMSYFAPIFLKKDIPDYFIIFKINDPINVPINELTEKYPYNKEEYIKEMFKKSSIIKTFDLREYTTVGKFLRNYVEDTNFPIAPLEVLYDENASTTFNGILYDNGVLGSRGEFLSDFYKSSNPLKYFEEFITLGFERNGVIFPNILNLEFVFDDNTSDYYDFNRYIGFYINEIELTKMDVDLDRVWNRRKVSGNTPIIRREYNEWEDVNIIQKNNEGVVIPFKNTGILFSDFENSFLDKDNLFFNYIKDRNGSIHSLNLNNPYDIDYLEGEEQTSAILRLSDTNINLGDFFGPGNLLIQDIGKLSNERGYSHSYIKILGNLSHLDAIKFYHPMGTRSDSNGRYELIEAIIDYPGLTEPGSYYSYNDYDGVAGHDTFYFNGVGLTKEIASAIAGCINNMRNISVKAYAVNEYVFIKSRVSSESDYLYKLQFTSPTENYDNIEIDKKTGSDLTDLIIQFRGGSRSLGNRLIVDGKHFDKINNRLDDILVKTTTSWSKIKKLSFNIDAINEDNLITSDQKLNAIESFFNNIDIALELEQTPKLDSGEFTMLLKHRPGFGFISFFPIKDFDFDFYSSEYLNFPLIDIYKHYYIPNDVNLLVDGIKYQIYGNGTIVYGENELTNGSIFTADSSIGLSYSIKSGDPIVSYPPIRDNNGNLIVGRSLWNEIKDENEEFKDFSGFFLLKDPNKVIAESSSDIFMLRDKYLNGIASSEYDYYKENSSKDFALRSKIIPYITKWVIPDGLDVRGNYYRLNDELVFGFNNFTPDHEDTSQNPSNFTHEWFYIESDFNFTSDPNTVKLNNSYFDESFDLEEALTNEDYFVEYFTYTPTFDGEEIGKTQTRYSPINKNDQGVYETFFKGFKIQFKDYIDANAVNAAGKPEWNSKSNRFEDYKFACLLKPIKEDINDDTIPPIRYRFIEHKDFKFILLLIELKIGGKDSIYDIWGKVQTNNYDGITNESVTSPSNLINMFDDSIFTTVNGDYRISYNDSDVSDLTYTSLYSLKNKKFNNLSENFSNIGTSFKLNLKKPGDSPLTKLIINGFENYPTIISEEILEIAPNIFIGIYDKSSAIDNIIDEISGIDPLNVSPIFNVKSDSIYFKNGSDIGIVNQNNSLVISIPPGISNNLYIQNNFVFKIIAGGKLYFETLLQKISFAKFKQYVNDLNSFIEYHSYSGNDLTEEISNFYTEIPNRSIVEKTDALLAVADTNKPGNLSFNNIIGYKYERAILDNSYEINRYEGGFSPLFKDLFYFKTRFNFTNNDIKYIDSGNISLNINIDDFLNIANFNHIKISNTKILSLESDKEFDPLYEIPGEIAIGRGKYDLLSSNWDYGFHSLYTDKNTKIPISGTIRIEEDDCFVSKLLKLRDDIELEQYTVEIVNSIKDVNIDNIEIVYEEKDTSIVGYINIKNALISYLINDGISSKFNEFLIQSPEYIGNYETIEDYVRDYVEVNIIKLYEIDSIEFYTKEDKELIEDGNNSNLNKIKFEMLNDKERFAADYKLSKNLQINKIDRYMLKFEFTKSLNSGTLISPKIKIKFI